MKTLIISLFVTSLFSIFGNACEQPEAQVIMNVVETRTDSLTFCKAYVSAASIEHYSESGICPLERQTVIELGVDFPLTNGHDCEVPKTISGILIQKNNRIHLD
jgi:hypothetical protein